MKEALQVVMGMFNGSLEINESHMAEHQPTTQPCKGTAVLLKKGTF